MNKSEKQLLNLYRDLPKAARSNLLEFAAFLAERYPPQTQVARKPLEIPRPTEESVIAAVKRLAATYPMLNKDTMLHDTSGLVTQHLVQGRDAMVVIDELEELFRQRYQSVQNNDESGQGSDA